MPPPIQEKQELKPYVEAVAKELKRLKKKDADELIDSSLAIITSLINAINKLKGDWSGIRQIIILAIDSLNNDRKIKKNKIQKVISDVTAFTAKLEILIENKYFEKNI